MPNLKNKQEVSLLLDKVTKAKSIVVTEYPGLKANLSNELRAKMKELGAEITVAKNTLLKIALKEKGYDTIEISKDLKGANATLFSYKDPIEAIKGLFEFVKTTELPKVKAGFLDGAFVTSSQIVTLSKLPSRIQLITQVISTMKSPITGFVNVLGGTQKKLVYALLAIAKSKEGGC